MFYEYLAVIYVNEKCFKLCMLSADKGAPASNQ